MPSRTPVTGVFTFSLDDIKVEFRTTMRQNSYFHFPMKVGLLSRLSLHTMLDRFPGNYDVEKFLEIFSEEDYDAFCLAYMFTYRCSPHLLYIAVKLCLEAESLVFV